jgi:drug/metabolite transporter (DMT)-like permease
LQYITAGLERLILFLTPSFVLLMSAIWYRRKVSMLEWAALIVSYFGIVLVFLHDLQFGGDDVLLGLGNGTGAAVSYAVYLIQSGQMVRHIGFSAAGLLCDVRLQCRLHRPVLCVASSFHVTAASSGLFFIDH